MQFKEDFEQKKKKDFLSRKDCVLNPLEALRFYNAIKYAQTQIDYTEGPNEINDIIITLEETRDFFLLNHLYKNNEEV